jgi:hypothetical protein
VNSSTIGNLAAAGEFIGEAAGLLEGLEIGFCQGFA